MKTNRFISLLLCVVMIMSLFTGLAGSASADDVITHEVQSGEILLKICENHGLNYYTCKNAIMQLNGFTSEAQLARLNVGQQLKLPASDAVAGTVSTTTATVTTTTVGGTTMTTTSYAAGVAAGGNVAFYLVPYTVKNGDTLNKICNELGSNYYYYSPVIQGINALANPNQIYAGQVLLIPTASAAGATSAVIGHVVKAGETMSSIANQYGINYQAQRQLINGLNRRDNMDKIYVGQTVLVPGAAAVSTGSVVTTTAVAAPATPATANGTYQISISAADNGSPYAVVNNTQYATRANAGEMVNIVPSPRAGYAVRSIQVVRTDSGTDIPVSNYAFTMPNSSVQVTVDYSRGLVINKVASPYGTFDAMIYGTNAGTAFFGDEVTLAIYPKNGYNVRFPDDAKTVSGVYYQKSDLSMERVYVFPDDADGLYRFKMPNYEIRLTVDFVISNYFSLGSGNTIGSGSIAYYVDGSKVSRAKEGDTVTMQFVPNDGWVFRNDLYESGGGMITLRNSVKDKKVTKINDTTYRFVVGSMAVNPGTYIFENRNTYGIGADVRGGHGWLSFQLVEKVGSDYKVVEREIGRALPGKLVEVVFHPDNEWAFKDATFMKNNSKGNWSGYQLNAGAWTTVGDRYIFQMPQEDVTIVVKYTKTGEVYYDLNLEYDWGQGTAVALQGGKTVARAKAGEEVTIQISANDNRRVSGVQWVYDGSGDNIWLPNVSGDSTNKTWTAKFTKHASWDTIRVYFEEYTEYTEIDAYQYRENILDGPVLPTATQPVRIEFRDQPGKGAHIRIGNTITFRVVSIRTGFSVGEVWVKRDGSTVRMLSPTTEGGDTYSYTVTKEDKGAKIQFVAVQLGKEPQHYIIPEYTISNTGISNVGSEVLYKVEYITNGGTPVGQNIGPVYGMGANLAVDDANIKPGTVVKVRVTIPKKSHEYVGAGTILIYQVDTVTIRFNDYVLNNYKVLQDGAENFIYEFWYNEVTDLNIMVNFKEIGTREADKPASGDLIGTMPTVEINGKSVTFTEGKATIVTDDKNAAVTIYGKKS